MFFCEACPSGDRASAPPLGGAELCPQRGYSQNAGHPKIVPRSRKTLLSPGRLCGMVGQERVWQVRGSNGYVTHFPVSHRFGFCVFLVLGLCWGCFFVISVVLLFCHTGSGCYLLARSRIFRLRIASLFLFFPIWHLASRAGLGVFVISMVLLF